MKITLINFKCWDNKTFEFGDKGVTLLSGQSGAGKTSIIEAIIFVLFGSGRKITKYGKKQCIVEMNTMWKEEKITIKRQKNPNRLVIMNGEKKYEDDAAQEQINKYYSDVYQNVGYLNQSSLNSFLLMGPLDKLAFLEKLVFQNMDMAGAKKKISGLIRERTQEVQITVGKIEMLEGIIRKEGDDELEEFPIKCNDKKICEQNQHIKRQNNEKLIINYNKKLSILEELYDVIVEYDRINKELEYNYKSKKDRKKVLEQDITDIDEDSYKNKIRNMEKELDKLQRTKEYRENIKIRENKKYKYEDGYKKEKEELLIKKKENEEIIEMIAEDIEDSVNEIREYLADVEKYKEVKKNINKREKELDNYKNIDQEYSRCKKTVEKLSGVIKNNEIIKKVYKCPKCESKLGICEDTKELICITSKNITNDKFEKVNDDFKKESEKLVLLEKKRDNKRLIESQIEELDVIIKKIEENYEEFIIDEEIISENRLIMERDLKTIQDVEDAKNELHNLDIKLKDKYLGQKYLEKLDEDIGIIDECNEKDLYEKLSIDDIEENITRYFHEIANEKIQYNNIVKIQTELNELNDSIVYYERKIKENEREYEDSIVKLNIKKMTVKQINKNKDIFKRKRKESEDIIKECEQNILMIEKWKIMRDKYEEREVKNKELSKLKDDEILYSNRLRSIYKLKDIIAKAESIAITNIINNINEYAARYLDLFFVENPINVRLSLHKIDKKDKENIILTVYYKEMESDITILSGGELQRVIIAFNLALAEIYSVPMVLLDECTCNLDQELTDKVIKGIKYSFTNKSVILIAHQVVEGIFDNIISI